MILTSGHDIGCFNVGELAHPKALLVSEGDHRKAIFLQQGKGISDRLTGLTSTKLGEKAIHVSGIMQLTGFSKILNQICVKSTLILVDTLSHCFFKLLEFLFESGVLHQLVGTTIIKARSFELNEIASGFRQPWPKSVLGCLLKVLLR